MTKPASPTREARALPRTGLGSRDRAAWRPEEVRLSDLRRRQESGAVDWLLLRAQWLPKRDRELVEAVYREGKTAAEIARLGTDSCSAVRYRIKQVVTRLCSDKLRFVVERSPAWSPTRQRVARQCIIEGRSMREAAQRLALTNYSVRRHISAINELYRAWLADQKPEEAERPASPPRRSTG